MTLRTIMVARPKYKPRYWLPRPRSAVPGSRRSRLDCLCPRINGQFRLEAQFYQYARSFGSFHGAYWTGELVDHRYLGPFSGSQLQQDGLGLCHGDQIAVLYWGHRTAGFVGIIGDPHHVWPTMLR